MGRSNKISKTGQDHYALISAYAYFVFMTMAKVLFLDEKLGALLCLHLVLNFFKRFQVS